MTARTCKCGAKGEVRHTRGDLRRIHCPICGTRWTTREKVQLAPKARPPKAPPAPKPARTIGQRMESRRGCLVPPELEADWKLLRSTGYSPFEAANSLKLPFKRPLRKPRQ